MKNSFGEDNPKSISAIPFRSPQSLEAIDTDQSAIEKSLRTLATAF